MALLKYEMCCTECARQYLVLAHADETETPNKCPFCGNDTTEVEDDDQG